MTVNLFTFVGLYSRLLDIVSHLLKKGAAHAQATEQSEEAILDWRLIDDMQPLRFQIMVVCNFTRQWTARTAGLPVPEPIADSLSLAEFHAAIADAKAYLASLNPEQFAGRDDAPVTFAIRAGMEPTLPAAQWLTGFATTNLYFHMSTAYGILRSKGVQIGKVDLFPTGL
jgi:hypothetical protein